MPTFTSLLLQCSFSAPLSASLEVVTANTLESNAHILQVIHSLALLVASSVAPENKLSANLFTAGMTMFSGSIYLLVLDPARFKFVGPVTPVGGLCLIAGWAALGFGS